MIKLVSPDDVQKEKTSLIPDKVFEAFNELIVLNFNGSSSVIKQETIFHYTRKNLIDWLSKQEINK